MIRFSRCYNGSSAISERNLNGMVNSQGFMLRMNSKKTGDRVPTGIQEGRVTIGWPCARRLITKRSRDKVREIVRKAYYCKDADLRRAGSATGNLWRFIHEMRPGALLVIPRGQEVYLAEVIGDADYDKTKVEEDTAYFRTARWLNPKCPFKRAKTPDSVQAKMRLWQTCIDATDILPDIQSLRRSIRSSP